MGGMKALIHHLLLMISSLNAAQLEQLAAGIRKLGDNEANPLAKPVTAPEGEEVDTFIDADKEEHKRLWTVIEKLHDKIEALESNRIVF